MDLLIYERGRFLVDYVFHISHTHQLSSKSCLRIFINNISPCYMNSRKKHKMHLPEKYQCNGLYLNYLSLCILNWMMMALFQQPKHAANNKTDRNCDHRSMLPFCSCLQTWRMPNLVRYTQDNDDLSRYGNLILTMSISSRTHNKQPKNHLHVTNCAIFLYFTVSCTYLLHGAESFLRS